MIIVMKITENDPNNRLIICIANFDLNKRCHCQNVEGATGILS